MRGSGSEFKVNYFRQAEEVSGKNITERYNRTTYPPQKKRGTQRFNKVFSLPAHYRSESKSILEILKNRITKRENKQKNPDEPLPRISSQLQEEACHFSQRSGAAAYKDRGQFIQCGETFSSMLSTLLLSANSMPEQQQQQQHQLVV